MTYQRLLSEMRLERDIAQAEVARLKRLLRAVLRDMDETNRLYMKVVAAVRVSDVKR